MARYCPNCGRKCSEFGPHKCVTYDTSPLAADPVKPVKKPKPKVPKK